MPPERSAPPPLVIGPYRILERLGAGGMGEVFLAQDDRLDRRVAIKRIRPEADTTPERRERFRREARMAARLSHSAIVAVYDLLQESDTDYLVLEYVPGTPLQEMLRRGPLPVPRALELARDLADGLDAAHRQGILHRDLKIENVLVTTTGRAKIADFGIAKRLLAGEPEESLTRDHVVVGTCRAMSPEQARGEPLDHRTDLFSLGVLLYEILSGGSPFAAEDNLATLHRVIYHRQTPLSELDPKIPQALSDLVDALLAKRPEMRPASAAQVRRELDRLALSTWGSAGSETIVEAPAPTLPSSLTSAVPRTAPPAARRRLRLLGWVALPVALALAAVLAYRAFHRPARPLYVAVLAPEIGAGKGNDEIALLASGVRVALLQGLVALEGVSPQGFEEVDAVAGSRREVARAAAVDEVVSSRLDCRTEVCRISLTRSRGDGRVLWAESFEVSAYDSTVVASAVRGRIEQGYSGHAVRPGGAAGLAASKADLDEFLQLRAQFDSRRDTGDAILARLDALRRRSPRYLEPYLLEARILLRRFWASRDPAHFDRALDLVQEAHRLAPGEPRPLFVRVDLALEAHRLDLAESSLAELQPLVPGDARLLERQARLLKAQGRDAQALALMRTAARLQPSSKRLHTLAQMELVQGQPAAARQTLALLFARSPGNVDGLSLLAQIEMWNGDLEKAAALYRDLVRRSPGMAELSNLGLAYLFLGRYAEAAEIFRRTLDQQPRNPDLVLNLADALLLLGRRAEAKALYGRLLQLLADDPKATEPQSLTMKAQALAHLGRGPEAVATLQEALRLAPDQGPVAFEASLVYALLGEEDSALVNAEKALRAGTDRRWFSLPWFAPLAKRADFQQLLRQAPTDHG